MKLKTFFLSAILFPGVFACTTIKNKELVKENFKFAQTQLKYAIACTDTLLNSSQNKSRKLINPRSIEKNGSLRVVGSHDWCSGFFPGSLWQVYAYTHDDYWKNQADKRTWPIEEVKTYKGTHDLGFILYSSFGKGYELTGNKDYKEVLLQAAKTLSTRFSPKVGAIRSWDFNRDKWQYPVIIDNMLNLELLFRATQESGDSTYYNIAVSHANVTLKNHFRNDHSSYHVINYDTITGKVLTKETFQGYNNASSWARGQAWGLYGFTMCYRFTKSPRYLLHAENIAHFLFTNPNMPSYLIPYWDLNDPAIPNSPRDASAACVIASGLYELSTYVSSDKSLEYRTYADKIIRNLSRHYRAKVGTTKGFLLLHSTGNHPKNDEIDVPISYADYFYLEALLRKDKIEKTGKALY